MASMPVDEEIRCLVNRLVDHTGPVWDGSAILRLKESAGPEGILTARIRLISIITRL
jgi:hypothetical protein